MVCRDVRREELVLSLLAFLLLLLLLHAGLSMNEALHTGGRRELAVVSYHMWVSLAREGAGICSCH